MGKGKEAVVVVGALAFVWLAIELAFKPFLTKGRDSIDKADLTRDPDDLPDIVAVTPDADADAGEAAAAGDAVADA